LKPHTFPNILASFLFLLSFFNSEATTSLHHSFLSNNTQTPSTPHSHIFTPFQSRPEINISNGGIRHCLRRCDAGSNSSNLLSRPQTLHPAPHFSSNGGDNGAPDPPLRPPELQEEENASEAQLRRDPAGVEGDRGGEYSGAENRRGGGGRSEEEGDEA